MFHDNQISDQCAPQEGFGVSELSLEEIEKDQWGSPPGNATDLIVRVHNLRRKPVNQLTAEEIRLLIGQEVGVATLLPHAIKQLKIDPLIEGDYYPGDLLSAVLRVPSEYWKTNPKAASDVRSILDAIAELPTALQEDVRNFRAYDT
jgi:hypothetical protein